MIPRNTTKVWKDLRFRKADGLFCIHQVLGSCGFQWCGFHSCTFSKNSPNIQLMWFSVHNWRNSFTHVFLVINDLSAADLVHANFCQTKKTARSKDWVYVTITRRRYECSFKSIFVPLWCTVDWGPSYPFLIVHVKKCSLSTFYSYGHALHTNFCYDPQFCDHT